VQQPDQAPWKSDRLRQWHFLKHGQVLGVPTVEAYDASARATIRIGVRFTFRDRSTGIMHAGFYHRRTQRLTTLRVTEDEILTHFRCDETYVRGLPESDYHR